jgi:hypothetical protein
LSMVAERRHRWLSMVAERRRPVVEHGRGTQAPVVEEVAPRPSRNLAREGWN